MSLSNCAQSLLPPKAPKSVLLRVELQALLLHLSIEKPGERRNKLLRLGLL
jgi:hypothetical protein